MGKKINEHIEKIAIEMFEVGKKTANKSLSLRGEYRKMNEWDKLQSHIKSAWFAVAKWHIKKAAVKQERI